MPNRPKSNLAVLKFVCQRCAINYCSNSQMSEVKYAHFHAIHGTN